MERQSSESDVQRWRRDFPILGKRVGGKPLVYLDNAATTQKPRIVIDAMLKYYTEQNANIHRAVHALSQEATTAYEAARETVRHFLNADSAGEIIFTRGTTESINLVADTYGRRSLVSGDEIVLSAMEHHSNIVPWQMLCQQTGAQLRIIPFNDRGELSMEGYERCLSERTRIVSLVHVSNSLGTINPVKRMIARAHQRGAVALIDGAQWVSHHPTDVQDLDADFYAFSGHKLYGPTGIGVLYGKMKVLEAMPPYQGGGDMIKTVTFSETTYADPPNKFEAGTPNIAGAIGLAAAIDYLQSVGWEAISRHEAELLDYAQKKLAAIPRVRLIGTAREKASVVSFVVEDPPISPMDLGVKLDAEGIAVRTGHHCCQPAMDRLGITGTARASLAFYNTTEEIDAMADALRKIIAESAPASAASAPELQFPEASAESPAAAADALAADFDLLGERDARNDYVMDLGQKLPVFPAVLQTEASRVYGCMSVVHLHSRPHPGAEDRLDFMADSNAYIVRGLIAVLEKLFSGQRTKDILAFDVDAFFKRIGLDQFIGSQRRNGLAAMVERIRAEASKLEKSLSLSVLGKKSEGVQTSEEAKPPPPPAAIPDGLPTKKLIEGKVIAALQTVYDPEIPVNIHELGLIYGIDVDDKNYVKIRMTLTSPACPVAGSLPGEVERKVEAIPEVSGAEVELTWEPPWSKDRMSEAAMLQLGLV
jgi:cysteine desulfurase / selenocysteine lyase